MSLFKRGNVWWMEIKLPNGEVERKSTKVRDREVAERLYEARKADVAPKAVGAKEAAKERTVGDALDRWLRSKELEGLKTIEEMRVKVRWWKERLGDVPLLKLSPLEVRDVIDAKREKDGSSNATANRHLAVIRATLRCCEIDWGWLGSAPKLRTFSEKVHVRERYLTDEEVKKLLAYCKGHLRDLVAFSLVTGLRQGNVYGLRWDWVDFEAGSISVPSSEYKTKRRHTIPMFDEARAILLRQQGKHPEFVFTYKGEPIKSSTNTAWRNAMQKAEIKDFRWHDLRHTFASHHAQKGTPLGVLQALGGWQSAAMVKRYAQHSTKSLSKYGSNSVAV